MKLIALSLGICLILFFSPVGAETLSTGGPYTVGDLISIQGSTNFNTDNKVLIEVYPASFGPTKKYDPSMSGGGSAVVPVATKGSGLFTWTANMSSAGWSPDQYMVRAEIIGKDYQETTLITLTENRIIEPQSSVVSMPVPATVATVPEKNESTQTPKSIPPGEKSETPVPVPTKQSPLSAGLLVCILLIAGFFSVVKRG